MASFFRSFYINKISKDVIKNIRFRVYNALLHKPIEYFDKVHISDCVSRLSHDLILIGEIITNILSFTVRNIFMVIGGVIMMFIQNVKLSLITILILPISLVLIKIIGKKVRALSTKSYEEKASMDQIIGETLSNIRIIHAFNVREYRIEKLQTQSNQFDLATNSYLRIRSLFFAMSIFIITSLLLIVVWIGGIDVLNGAITSGNMVSFIFFAITTAFAIGGVSEIFGNIQTYFAAAERVFELDGKEKNPKSKIPIDFKLPLNISIHMEKFSYASRPLVEVIKNITITAKSGEFIGIAGPSGSGKSTILQIIMGIYRPSICKIIINDKEQNGFSNISFQNKIAYVPQDPFLFSTTIEENITLGRSLGSLDKIIEICGLSDMLEKLPYGINTYVGEKGAQISGGQKQRISIARSLYGNPEILLLDEATSALDSESENHLLSNLKRFMKDKITISVAHRLSSIIDADKIIFVYNGEFIAEGSHDELVKKEPLYNTLTVSGNIVE